jgi:hypothetical protein
MALLEKDVEAIKHVARLLTGNHTGADAKALMLEVQMIQVANDHRGSGNGALRSWTVSAGTLAKLLLIFVDEQKEMCRNLKI